MLLMNCLHVCAAARLGLVVRTLGRRMMCGFEIESVFTIFSIATAYLFQWSTFCKLLINVRGEHDLV